MFPDSFLARKGGVREALTPSLPHQSCPPRAGGGRRASGVLPLACRWTKDGAW